MISNIYFLKNLLIKEIEKIQTTKLPYLVMRRNKKNQVKNKFGNYVFGFTLKN